MWMVWTDEDGLCGIFDTKEEAEKEYEVQKKAYKNAFDGEFYGNEHVVLAEVKKNFYSYDTKNPAIDYDEDGEEFETGDTYWDWKEDVSE